MPARSMIWAGIAIAGVSFVQLTGPHGQAVYVNPSEVSSVRELRAESHAHFAHGTRCGLVMSNGNLVSVRETCDEVRKRLEGGAP